MSRIDRILDNPRKYWYIPISLLLLGGFMKEFAWYNLRTVDWMWLRPVMGMSGYFFILISFVFSIATSMGMIGLIKKRKQNNDYLFLLINAVPALLIVFGFTIILIKIIFY